MSDEDEASRTQPFGLLRYAQEYFEAGVAAYPLTRHKPSSPALYLMGHSIELSLKAFLLAKGLPLSALRSWDYGHNLHALLDEAMRHNLNEYVELSQVDAGVIHLLNVEYASKRFEYIRTGMMTVPEWHLLESVAGKLSRRLQPFCVEHTK